MRLFGTATIADIAGDLVFYRNLNSQDKRIPEFRQVWRDMDLPSRRIPRKHEAEYAQAAAWFVNRARTLDAPRTRVQELLFLGDTALADGNAFRNIRQAGAWQGWSFIGSGVDENKPSGETWEERADGVTIAGRWNSLGRWAQRILEQGAAIDERTAVVVDMDKTIIGARGRNSQVIDAARLAGLRTTMRELLGSAFQQDAFEQVYHELNQPRYHEFTADNQDYLAYVCLIVSAGVISLDALLECLTPESGLTFLQFVRWADMRLASLNQPVLSDIHFSFYQLMESDDPTPFKTFRRREYLATVERMNKIPDDEPVEEHLAEEICLTNEVFEVGRWMAGRGALLIVLSDKPDEASIPDADQASQGLKALHHMPTHLAGESIADQLP